jgi:hypothetical protein
MLTARDAFQQLVLVLQSKISAEHLSMIQSRIEKSISEGKCSTTISVDTMFNKTIDISDKSKIVRHIEVYLKALGYKVDVPYGLTSLIIDWI